MAAQRNSDPRDKRRRIHDAAIQVFAEKGFYSARVSDIARAAGVADGTIYLYFKNKDDLLISLFEDRMEHIIAEFRASMSERTTATTRLKRFIELHLEMVAERPRLAEVLTVELRQSSKFMREYKAPRFQEYLQLLGGIVVEGQTAGEFDAELHPTLLKRIIFGALDEVALHWVSARRKPYTLERAAHEIWTICARGLLAERAA
jgi:TetR/AcrR family fatty acid metabolism transcriptional regulator